MPDGPWCLHSPLTNPGSQGLSPNANPSGRGFLKSAQPFWMTFFSARSLPCSVPSPFSARRYRQFHVVGQDKRGAIMLRQKWSRGQVQARLANLRPV